MPDRAVPRLSNLDQSNLSAKVDAASGAGGPAWTPGRAVPAPDGGSARLPGHSRAVPRGSVGDRLVLSFKEEPSKRCGPHFRSSKRISQAATRAFFTLKGVYNKTSTCELQNRAAFSLLRCRLQSLLPGWLLHRDLRKKSNILFVFFLS